MGTLDHPHPSAQCFVHLAKFTPFLTITHTFFPHHTDAQENNDYVSQNSNAEEKNTFGSDWEGNGGK